jgi:hypothetical protein
MAKTFFGWAERDIEKELDWSEISKQFSTAIEQEATVRTERAKALEDASNKYVKDINSIPLGDNKTANQYIMDAASQMQQTMLMYNRKLNSGELSLAEYTRARQNLFDGTDQMTGIFKTYNEDYSTKMERMAKDESSSFEQFIMKGVEGMTDFNNTRIYVNPLNGQVGVAKMKKDPQTGQMVPDASNDGVVPLSSLANRIKAKYDRYDYDASLQEGAKRMGKELATTLSADKRTSTTMEDVMQKPSYKNAETAFVSGLIVSPFQTGEVLVSALGYEYTWNADEASKDPNKILVSYDERGNITPKITDAQKKEAEKALRDRFRTMLDREVRKTYTPPPASTTSASTATKKTAEQLKAEMDAKRSDLKNRYAGYLLNGDGKTGPVLYPELIDRNSKTSADQLMEKVGPLGFLVEEGDGVVRVYSPILGIDNGIDVEVGGRDYIRYDADGKPKTDPENTARYNKLKANIGALAQYVVNVSTDADKIRVLNLDPNYLDPNYVEQASGTASVSVPAATNVDQMIQEGAVPDLRSAIGGGTSAQSPPTIKTTTQPGNVR